MRTHHNDPTNAAKKRVLCAIAAKVTRTVCASAVDGAGAHNKCALKIEKNIIIIMLRLGMRTKAMQAQLNCLLNSPNTCAWALLQ